MPDRRREHRCLGESKVSGPGARRVRRGSGFLGPLAESRSAAGDHMRRRWKSDPASAPLLGNRSFATPTTPSIEAAIGVERLNFGAVGA